MHAAGHESDARRSWPMPFEDRPLVPGVRSRATERARGARAHAARRRRDRVPAPRCRHRPWSRGADRLSVCDGVPRCGCEQERDDDRRRPWSCGRVPPAPSGRQRGQERARPTGRGHTTLTLHPMRPDWPPQLKIPLTVRQALNREGRLDRPLEPADEAALVVVLGQDGRRATTLSATT